MHVLALQLDIAWESKPENFAKVRRLLSPGVPKGSLIVLPEMFATGFSMNVAATAEPPGGETETFLSHLAKQHGAFVLAGVVSRGESKRGCNEAVVFSPGGDEIARYCKLHPFTPGGEMKNYWPGEQITLFDFAGLKVCPFVCYDLRFPEIFRHATRMGAQMFCVIASWPCARADHWVTLLQARAIENQAYVVGVNRCGKDPNFPYPGRTMIIGPHGAPIADAGDKEGVISAPVNAEAVTQYRAELPFLQDIRPDFVPGNPNDETRNPNQARMTKSE